MSNEIEQRINKLIANINETRQFNKKPKPLNSEKQELLKTRISQMKNECEKQIILTLIGLFQGNSNEIPTKYAKNIIDSIYTQQVIIPRTKQISRVFYNINKKQDSLENFVRFYLLLCNHYWGGLV